MGDQKFPPRSRGSFYGRGLHGEGWKAGKMVVVPGGPRFLVATNGGRRGMEVRGLRD